MPMLKFTDINNDVNLLKKVRDIAEEMIWNLPKEAKAHLHAVIRE